MCELDVRLSANASGPRPQRQGEGRNNDLWKRVMREAHHVDDFEQLLDRAETLNQDYVDPMQQARSRQDRKECVGNILSAARIGSVSMGLKADAPALEALDRYTTLGTHAQITR